MRLSRERLQREATATGFRVEIVEKVAQLLDLLDGFNRHPYLKGRLALKGGTALNLFVFDVPRLSIDIDLNYVGQLDPQRLRIAFVVYGARNARTGERSAREEVCAAHGIDAWACQRCRSPCRRSELCETDAVGSTVCRCGVPCDACLRFGYATRGS